jgi:hypothetical protein
MIIPISDRVFTIRSDHLVPAASAVLIRKLEERLQLFRQYSLLPELPLV